MAQRIKIPFIGPTAVSRSVAVDNQETVNLTQIVQGAGAKARVILESIPGIVLLGAAGNGPLRSPKMVNWKGDLYGVFGDRLIKFTIAGAVTDLGTLNTTAGTVHIARGRNYIALVDGTDGWTYDGTTFAQITDLDFPANATHIIYMDGFFQVNESLTDNFYISALEDPTSWNALDFEAASVAPDNALAMANTESILYIIGDETAQLYYNSGNVDFPYTVMLNATVEVGIAAPHSIAETDDGVFWLATTPEGGLFVYRMIGQSGGTITEEAQETLLGTITDPTTAYGFIYTQGKNSYYVLQLGDGAITMIYNIRAGSWETRTLNDGSAWRVSGHGKLGQRNIVGSRLQANYYELDRNVYTDSGANIIKRRRTQIYHVNNYTMDWLKVTFVVQGGVGLVSGPGSDPQLRLRYSDDFGATWSDWLDTPIGKIGKRQQQCSYFGLGQSRNRQFEVANSDAIPLTLVEAYAEVDVLRD